MKNINLNCEYVQGYLKSGHFELDLNDEDYQKFLSLPKEEQLDWIKDCGKLIIDNYSVDDYQVEKDFTINDVQNSNFKIELMYESKH